MVRIDDAARCQDKAALIRMGSNLLNDCEEYLSEVYESAGITDEDIERHTISEEDSQLLVQAASSNVGARLSIVTASVQTVEHNDDCNCAECVRARGNKKVCPICHYIIGEGCKGHDETDFEVNIK